MSASLLISVVALILSVLVLIYQIRANRIIRKIVLDIMEEEKLRKKRVLHDARRTFVKREGVRAAKVRQANTKTE